MAVRRFSEALRLGPIEANGAHVALPFVTVAFSEALRLGPIEAG